MKLNITKAITAVFATAAVAGCHRSEDSIAKYVMDRIDADIARKCFLELWDGKTIGQSTDPRLSSYTDYNQIGDLVCHFYDGKRTGEYNVKILGDDKDEIIAQLRLEGSYIVEGQGRCWVDPVPPDNSRCDRPERYMPAELYLEVGDEVPDPSLRNYDPEYLVVRLDTSVKPYRVVPGEGHAEELSPKTKARLADYASRIRPGLPECSASLGGDICVRKGP